MALKIDTKFEGKLGLPKMTWGIWQMFTRALESLKIGTMMASFCQKLKMYELKIYRGIMSWQWRMMQKLKRNWLCQFKNDMRNLTWALENLKNLHINGLLLTKVYNVWAKKVQRSYVWWHWRLMQSLKENWLVISKMT